ncbi:uncharacterized protein EI97DRAFT_45390 [Westerdykella ornata]|uniref:Rhodopsin domain-containing protein n=1 Tax=Westerdykella ornata TaxID=318751 RepID=A0A6A6JJG2_WESOR|nr:uncharacterized protein EI97DRAFT_45390 [Westerdykella ornata]KAF2276602.1 hypothetical protein EI97DRAFT_45390 [Westerdykella ornata]
MDVASQRNMLYTVYFTYFLCSKSFSATFATCCLGLVVAMKHHSPELVLGLGVGCMVIPCVFTGLRMWAKRLGKGCLSWDDYFAVGALAITITTCGTQIVATVHGRLGKHQIVHANGQPVLDDPEFLVYEHTKFIQTILITVGLGCIKASILLFYNGIFSRIRSFRIAVHIMLGIVAAWVISHTFANIFLCWPVTVLIEPYFGNKCINAGEIWLSNLYTDIIVDVAILIMPIPMVLRLQLPWAQKLGIIGVFMLGTLVCATSVTRAVVLTKMMGEYLINYNDLMYWTAPAFFWSNIELSLAVVCASLPP